VKKANRIALPILAIVICGFLAWRFWPQPEPTYKGKSLTTWLQGYGVSELLHDEANEAVQSIGTNGISILLRRLRAPPCPPLKAKLINLGQKLRLLRKYNPDGFILNQQGKFGFQALGAVAKDAAPQLLVIYEQNISPSSQEAALDSLGTMGSPTAQMAIPLAIRQTTNTDSNVRAHGIGMLSTFHDQPELVMPYLGSSDKFIPGLMKT
jgi:hypothetical protein